MGSNRFKTVSKEEASYEVTKALLPFLIEAGTPVYTTMVGNHRAEALKAGAS